MNLWKDQPRFYSGHSLNYNDILLYTDSPPQVSDLPFFLCAREIIHRPAGGIRQSCPHLIEQRTLIDVFTSLSNHRTKFSEWSLVLSSY